MADSSRWYMTLVLDSLYTTTSGEALGREGEWYFKVGGHRWPQKGHVKLSKNETFTPPDPKPHLWSAVLSKLPDPIKLDILVKEEDVIKDDTMLEGQITLFFESKDKIVELHSKDGRVTLKVRLIVAPAPNW